MRRRRRIRNFYARFPDFQETHRLVSPSLGLLFISCAASMENITHTFSLLPRDETQTIVSNPDPHSTVAHLYLSRLSLEDKPGHPSEESFDGLQERLARCVTVPAVLDEDSETVRAQVCQIWGDDKGTESLSQTIKELDLSKEIPTVRADVAPPAPPAPSVSVVDGWLNFSLISAVNETDESAEELSIEDELSICFERLIGS